MTAIESLEEKLKKYCLLTISIKRDFKEAKEIEREQIENAYAQALANERDCDLGMRELCSAHTYYEKTYIK